MKKQTAIQHRANVIRAMLEPIAQRIGLSHKKILSRRDIVQSISAQDLLTYDADALIESYDANARLSRFGIISGTSL